MQDYPRASKAFEFLKYSILALIPILDIYDGISFIKLGTLLLLGIMIIEIVKQKGNVDINLNLLLIITFLGVMNLIAGFVHITYLSLSGYMHNSVAMFLFAIVWAYFAKKEAVKEAVFYKYIKIIALASSFFLLIQYYLYAKGVVLYGFVPFLKSELIKDYVYISISYGRPNSFFLEPAHFAIYVLPVYALSLLKRDYFTSIILFSSLILSTSTTGVGISIIVTLIFLSRERRLPIVIKWIIALAGATCVLRYIPYLTANEAIEKLSFTQLKENRRIFGTLQYFKYFTIKELMLGVGMNRMEEYLSVFAKLRVGNYANGFIFSFFSFGIIGGAIWNAYMFSLYYVSRNKMLFVVFILIYLSDQLLFNQNLSYLLLTVFVFSDTGYNPKGLTEREE